MADRVGYWLAGRCVTEGQTLAVRDKFTDAVVAEVVLADWPAVERAVAAAAGARRAMRAFSGFDRRQSLQRVIDGLLARRGRFVDTLIAEAGKPRRFAEGEFDRCIETFTDAVRWAGRLGGACEPLDIAERGRDYFGVWRRVPIGVVLCITPFNFPLNLVAHKVAPAIAAGCPFLVKPASATPLSALLLGEVLAEAGLPEGAFSVLPMPSTLAEQLVQHPDVAMISFTGSAEVGWRLKAITGRKKVGLELGGNAGAIVCEDADLADAARRLTAGAFGQAGQSCISVQRVFVHRAVYERFCELLVAETGKCKAGDPREPDVVAGPLIDDQAARRVEEWVQEALEAGARLLCGGRRSGRLYEPTWLAEVPHHCPAWCQEIFGPVACVEPVDSFEAALRAVNDSEYGLQAAVFTRDYERALRAFEELEVGGVMINEAPTFRVDSMPYGGSKASGEGREGVRFAMEEMTEIRIVVMRRNSR